MRSYYPVVFIATYFCIFTNNVSANNQSGEHPWDKIFSPYSDDQSELALEKDHRWEICSRMTSSVSIAAGAIYRQKNRDPKFKTPSDAADVKELLFDMYPINTETFEDQINQKFGILLTHIGKHGLTYLIRPMSPLRKPLGIGASSNL
ncbi:hypothetical protein [Enterovibrio norvegicus]|uniref:hypothetical protein n=1 Tax=Enterovibrio norvegicus TaxID=188144 RepID=UPI000377104B|nr:hypothetical protein [Enterovibrio norvegicus]